MIVQFQIWGSKIILGKEDVLRCFIRFQELTAIEEDLLFEDLLMEELLVEDVLLEDL